MLCPLRAKTSLTVKLSLYQTEISKWIHSNSKIHVFVFQPWYQSCITIIFIVAISISETELEFN